MLIIAFDPSKSTGWAAYRPADRNRDYFGTAVKCGVLEMPKKADAYYTADQIGLKVTALLRSFVDSNGNRIKPDFAVLEQQAEAQISVQGRDQSFAGSIFPWVATSSIVATLANFGIPYGTIAPATWRKTFFPAGYKPPQNPVLDKNKQPALDKFGKPKFKSDWKAAAVSECERLGIELPPQKTVSHNAAEACALAISWFEARIHAGRYEAPLTALLQRRNTKEAA